MPRSRLLVALLAGLLALSTHAARRNAPAQYVVVDRGRAVELSPAESSRMCGTHYAVVCLDAEAGASIDGVTPRHRKACGKLVKRVVIDANTWGFVYEVKGGPVPFAVWGKRFREGGAVFWVEKRR